MALMPWSSAALADGSTLAKRRYIMLYAHYIDLGLALLYVAKFMLGYYSA